jgi:hypothetical protein
MDMLRDAAHTAGFHAADKVHLLVNREPTLFNLQTVPQGLVLDQYVADQIEHG